MLRTALGFISAIAIMSMALPAHAQAEALNASQLQADIVGKTLVGKRMGMTMKMTLIPDGGLVMQTPVGKRKGKWRINGDRLCFSAPKRDENCTLLTPQPDGGFLSERGNVLYLE